MNTCVHLKWRPQEVGDKEDGLIKAEEDQIVVEKEKMSFLADDDDDDGCVITYQQF